MISLILGIITLIKIGNYKSSKRFADAKSAGTLGTVNLVFTIIQLLPVVIFGLFILAAVGEMIVEANGNIDEIIVALIVGGIMLIPSVGLTAFGFITSSKGRKLWKSVNTYGSPDYVPVSERNNSGYSYNQNRYAQNQNSYSQNQNRYNYTYGGNNNTTAYGSNTTALSGSKNSGFYNSSGLYGDAANETPVTNVQNTAPATPVQSVQSTSTQTVTNNGCDYGRSETGYIPHPESSAGHCDTHSFVSNGNKKWRCPSCGKNNKAEESFCRNCGTNRTATF